MTDEAFETPDISVIVASFSGEATLVRCLESLADQAGSAEVIVPTTAPAEAVGRLEARFPGVTFLASPAGASVFRLRTLGVARARGRTVVLTEDHCTASPRWLAALSAASQAGHPVVGGPVENGLDRRVYDWALFFCEYAAFLPPQPEGPAAVVSGINVAYHRSALLQCRPAWSEAFHENEVHDALAAAGVRLHRAGQAVVASHLAMSLREAMGHLFGGARHYGGYRKSRASGAARGLLALAAPAVPAVLLWRIVRVVATRRPSRLVTLTLGLPYLACLLAAWTAGEALGYLAPTPTPTPRLVEQPTGVV